KIHQFTIFGKKENVFQESARGIGDRHRFDLVLRALGEQVKSGDRRAMVLSRPVQLAREGRAKSVVSIFRLAHVRDLVGEKGDIGWRKARDRRLSRPGGTGE